jgi:hypothetical protein
MITTVVNIYQEPYDQCIGRAGKGQDGYYGNPFRLQPNESRGATIDRFRKYFFERLKTDNEFRKRVHQLKGKKLGCFCKPYACHGDVYVEYLEALPNQFLHIDHSNLDLYINYIDIILSRL